VGANYFYLISSLPTLTLTGDMLYSPEAFMEFCNLQLSEGEYSRLEEVGLLPAATSVSNAHERWNAFETEVRNVAVHIRAHKLKSDPTPHVQDTMDLFGGLETHVQDAFSHNPLGMEEHLDAVRWQFLDGLLVGKDFSFDAVVVYKIKLLLKEKRHTLDREKGRDALEQILSEKLTSDQLPEFIHG
jgi:hypothetical protein